MNKISYDEFDWKFLKDENVEVGFNKKLVFGNKFDVAHAKLGPKQTLNKHYHERGENGQEVFCFYNGGHFKILFDKGEEEIKTNNPYYINFGNHEIHGITNLSYKALEFQVWCDPPFKPGEVKITKE